MKSGLKKYAKAQKAIIMTIDKRNINHVMCCESAKEIFDKFCSIYERDSEQSKSKN